MGRNLWSAASLARPIRSEPWTSFPRTDCRSYPVAESFRTRPAAGGSRLRKYGELSRLAKARARQRSMVPTVALASEAALHGSDRIGPASEAALHGSDHRPRKRGGAPRFRPSASQARRRSTVPTASASQARQRSTVPTVGLASEAALHGGTRPRPHRTRS
jgi:hypothetical protein